MRWKTHQHKDYSRTSKTEFLWFPLTLFVKEESENDCFSRKIKETRWLETTTVPYYYYSDRLYPDLCWID